VIDSAARSRPDRAAAPPPPKVGQEVVAPGSEPEQIRSDAPPNCEPLPPPDEAGGSTAGNSQTLRLSDPLAAWRDVAAGLEGLAADFAATATAARWRDDLLEVTLPAEAAAAAGILRRPDAAAAIAAGLERLAGRPIRHAVVLAAADAVALAPAPAARKPPAASQSALVKAATAHPLVAHARTLFDAAIRKVEPPRPRPPEVAGVGVAGADQGRSAGRGAADVAELDGGLEPDV